LLVSGRAAFAGLAFTPSMIARRAVLASAWIASSAGIDADELFRIGVDVNDPGYFPA
jgi:hypothetical protein